MPLFVKLVQAIASLVVIYLLAVNLRRRGVLKEKNALTLARIVTDLCLPAVVFVNLASFSLTIDHLGPSMVMLSAELSCIVLAWAICAALKFSRDVQGAVVFCSAFGSSTFLGYAVIMELFPGTPAAMTEAVLISEIGVGYPIFILGPILASYFGSSDESIKGNLKDSLGFFKSPVFFALILGLVWQPLGLPDQNNTYLQPVFAVCHTLAQALTPLAILSVGLMFKVPGLREIMGALAIVVGVKLFLKPLGLGVAADALAFPHMWKDVLVLLGAMPPAVLGAVFLRRYGGNAAMASTLLLVGTALSCGSILLVFWLAG